MNAHGATLTHQAFHQVHSLVLSKRCLLSSRIMCTSRQEALTEQGARIKAGISLEAAFEGACEDRDDLAVQQIQMERQGLHRLSQHAGRHQ